MKKSFLLHIDSLCILNDLTDEQSGQLFKAMYQYQIGEVLELPAIIKIAFSQFKNQFDRDDEKYTNTCEARKKAGSRGGKQRVANQANANKSKQDEANQAENKNKNKNENKNENENENKNENTLEILNPLINEESYNEWVAFKKIKVKGTITKLINFLVEYDKPTQKIIIDNSIMNNYKGLFPPKNTPTKQQSSKPNEKTLDEVLNIYIHQRKAHTSQDYTFAKCKEMLHWNLRKEFTKLSTSFEQKMMLAYGYDWVNGRIDFTTDENIIEVENR